jgi:CHAT domain-containing protein/Tfp pilus assembly protein PilF
MAQGFKTAVTQKQLWLGLVPLISLSGIICLLLGSQSFAAIPEQMAPRIAQQPANSDTAEQVSQEALQLYRQETAESLRQAIPKLEQAVILYRQAGDKRSEAASLFLLGNVYNKLGEKQKALEFYNQALPLYRAVGDRGGEANALKYIGWVYDDLDEKQKALDYYQQALQLARALGERVRESSILSNIGLVYSNLGEQQKALDYYQQALQLVQGIDIGSGKGSLLNNIGLAYWSLGDKQKALDYYQQALSIFQSQGSRFDEATTLNNIGLLYSELGEQQQALDHLNQALSLHRKLGNLYGEAATLDNIGSVYLRLGSYQQALDHFNEALPLSQTVGDRSREALTLGKIGVVYAELGKHKQALDYYNQSLSLKRSVGDRIGEAYTLSNIGMTYLDLGDQQQALNYHNQALPLRQAVGDRSGEAITLINIGFVYNDLGDKHRALEYYQKALPIFQSVGNPTGEAACLNSIARVERGLGNLQTALTQIQAAIAIVEDLRTKIGSQELRASYFATVQDYYEFYIDLLMQLHQQNPSQGYDALALHTSERARARSLLELLTEANANIRQGVDPKLLEQERTLQQQLNALEHRRHELASSQYTEQQLDEIKQQSKSLLTQLDQLKAQIRVTSPRYADLKYPQPLNLQQIQQQVLDDDTLLLQYSLGKDRSFLWAVTKNSITSYVLPKQSEIEAAVKTFRESVTKDNSATIDTGLPLSQMLLAPVANQLGNKRLLIVGDGALQFVPFAALPIPASPTNPLLVQNEIVTLPSASTVAIQRRQLQNRTPVAKTVAVIADPVFSLKDSRITGNPPTPTNNTLSELSLNRAARNLGLGEDGGGKIFDRLQFTRTEADKILALVSQGQRLQAFDFDASRQIATNPDLSQYQIIHFATHGLLDPVNPELSGIVLSLYDENGKSQDGFLRLHDIFNLNLPAELVVLSACETGLGENVKGEGLVGLTRGFMYAGSRRVVVSLWSVNDAATSELMAKFYQKILQGGKNPVKALREAQLEMWNSPNRQSPYYWAAFTVQGDWR